MKIKKVKVGIKDVQTALNEFVETGKSLQKGNIVKKDMGVYFTSVEAFRRALTPKRIEVLQCHSHSETIFYSCIGTNVKQRR